MVVAGFPPVPGVAGAVPLPLEHTINTVKWQRKGRKVPCIEICGLPFALFGALLEVFYDLVGVANINIICKLIKSDRDAC